MGLLAGIINRGLQILLAPLVGWVADVQGVGCVTLFGALVQMFAGAPLFAALSSHPADSANVLVVFGIGYALVGALVMTVPFLFVAELFPTVVRNSGVGI